MHVASETLAVSATGKRARLFVAQSWISRTVSNRGAQDAVLRSRLGRTRRQGCERSRQRTEVLSCAESLLTTGGAWAMSGMAGICNFNGQDVDPAQLLALGSVLAERGPDG